MNHICGNCLVWRNKAKNPDTQKKVFCPVVNVRKERKANSCPSMVMDGACGACIHWVSHNSIYDGIFGKKISGECNLSHKGIFNDDEACEDYEHDLQ